MRTPPDIIIVLINFVTGLVESLLVLRVALRLFGASQTAPFVQWVTTTTDPLLAPFEGMFPTSQLEGGLVIDFSTLFALIAYAILGYLAGELFLMLRQFFSRYDGWEELDSGLDNPPQPKRSRERRSRRTK